MCRMKAYRDLNVPHESIAGTKETSTASFFYHTARHVWVTAVDIDYKQGNCS